MSKDDNPLSISRTRRLRAADIVMVGLVVAIACVFAARMLAGYAADPGQLWQDLNHDRNGHFGAGLDLALALKSADIPAFLESLSRARVWPPVHALVLAGVMSLGAADVRLAIVPSLFGWVCTIVLTFLIARRLMYGRSGGNIAGAIGATFALASPAFRLITADVMLEGLGAALTACCLYVYLRGRAEPDNSGWWGVLALALTALFFEKYNYWVLTAASLGSAFLSEDLSARFTWIGAQLAKIKLRHPVRFAIRDPYLIAAVILILLVIAIYLRGPTAIEIAGRHVSLYPPENLVTAIWWVLFIRMARLWQAYRKDIEATIGIAGRRLLYWHLLPIAISFLIPKRLSAFLWYVGPAHHHGNPYRPLQAIASQWTAFSEGFHVAPWAALIVIALVAVAAFRLARLAPGGRAAVILAVLSAVAVVLHPQQQWRFQATWLFSVWSLAGAGGAIVLQAVTSRLPEAARIMVAVAVVAGIAIGQSRSTWTGIAYAVAIHPRPGGASDLGLARAYLPFVRGMRKVGFLITFPRTSFLSWTVREDCQCLAKIDMPWLPPLTREQYRRNAADWLARTTAERIVVIDLARYAIPSLGLTYERLSAQVEAIEQDGRFARLATEHVPSLGATITIWHHK